MFRPSMPPTLIPCSKLVIATIFLLFARLIAGQSTSTSFVCTGCSNLLNLQVVFTGLPVYLQEPNEANDTFSWVATAAPVTHTQDCTAVSSFDPDGKFLYTGCEDWIRGQPPATLTPDGLVLIDVSISETIIDAYTSFGMISFGSDCPLVSEVVKFKTPLTIGASNAYLTVSTDTLTSKSAKKTTTLVTSVVLESDIWKSLIPTCRTPAAWLKPVSVTQIGSQPTSTLTLQTDSSIGLAQSSRILIGLILGTSLLTWLGFLVFLIWWRRAIKRSSDQSQTAPRHENFSLARIPGFRSQALRIPGIKTSKTKKPTKSTRPQRSWKAPLIMLAGLICGSCFALGHHFLYQNINGLPINNVQTSQGWFLRSGNLLAALVKLSYAISIGVVFVQVQWLKLHQVQLRVKDIDALSNVLSDILNIFGNSVWLRLPTLTLLAVIFWLTALVPIFTPGTLNVQPLPFQNITYIQVPQLDYSNMTQWTSTLVGPDNLFSAIGSIATRQIALATAIGGQILPLSPYLPNGTYILDFHGPAIQCYNASEDIRQEFLTYYVTEGEMLHMDYRYVSKINLYFNQDDSDLGFLDSASDDYSRIWIMTPESSLDNVNQSYLVTECGLFNAEYRMQFSYQDAQQKVDVLHTEYLDGVSWLKYQVRPLDTSTPIDVPTYEDKLNQMGSYCGLMAELGSILVGNIQVGVDLKPASNTKVELLNFDYIGIGSQELQAKLEELFQNMTISLLSRQQFQKNSTQAEWVRVEDHVQVVSYVYDSVVLVITYGLAFILTQICVLLGLYAVAKNRGTYQNRFSTFLRATKNTSELRKYSNMNDDATDPRPKKLSRATVNIFRPQQPGNVELRIYPTQDDAHKNLLTEVLPSNSALPSPTHEQGSLGVPRG